MSWRMRRRHLGILVVFALVLAGAAARWNPARAQAPDPTQVAEGSQLYAQNCAVCHGPNGEGRVGATLAKNWPSIRPDLTVRTIIANGVQGSPMPAWSQQKGGPLNDAQIDALTAFILTWQTGSAVNLPPQPTFTAHPPIQPPPNVEGDPNAGAALFGQNCAVCHGPNGEGRIGATLAKTWPSIRPDLTVKTTIEQGVPGSPMPAWGQQYGGPLSEVDINNLTAFILSRSPQTAGEAVTTETAAPVTASWLSGWGGVVVFFVLFVVIVAGAMIIQRRTV